MCGERTSSPIFQCAVCGSSPRVRGTRLQLIGGQAQGRFIPACAGNATTTTSQRASISVHPRVCGERPSSSYSATPRSGSSPRVRGTQFIERVDQLRRRFIPACAGNARCARIRRRPTPVHPRVCGERSNMIDAEPNLCGSSPRVRGTLAPICAAVLTQRFIPACAGNADLRCWRNHWPTVHPRVCGERAQQRRLGLR